MFRFYKEKNNNHFGIYGFDSCWQLPWNDVICMSLHSTQTKTKYTHRNGERNELLPHECHASTRKSHCDELMEQNQMAVIPWDKKLLFNSRACSVERFQSENLFNIHSSTSSSKDFLPFFKCVLYRYDKLKTTHIHIHIRCIVLLVLLLLRQS